MIQRIVIWSIIVAIVGIIVLAIIGFFLQPSSPTQTNATSSPSNGLPVAGNVPGQTTPGTSLATSTSGSALTIATRSGTSVTVPNFITNGVTIPDPSNPGQYLLAGSLGYCSTRPGPCYAASSTNYNILYNANQQTFLIALTKEPIGQARTDAQNFLLHTLGISQTQLCSLSYYVGTTYQVNPIYDTKNLGFSFCQGATQLP